MSAIPRISDITRTSGDVRDGPKGDITDTTNWTAFLHRRCALPSYMNVSTFGPRM